MKLNQLLQSHGAFEQAEGLPGNLGDGYLLTHNRIYKNIRKAAKDLHYKFVDQPDNFYQALPLSQLDNLMAKKTIPYTDNVSVLEHLETTAPGRFYWDDVTDNLKKNYLFHESCHAVAKDLTRQFKNEKDPADDLANRILSILLEESFANTCELLGVAEAKDQTHRIFYEQNSYICMFSDRTLIHSALLEIGDTRVFMFFVLAYLHSNFLHQSLDEHALARILILLQKSSNPTSTRPLEPKQIKALKALGKIAFQLNPRFREVTTGFYLRLNGINGNLKTILNFDFLHLIESKEGSQKLLAAMAGLATGAKATAG